MCSFIKKLFFVTFFSFFLVVNTAFSQAIDTPSGNFNTANDASVKMDNNDYMGNGDADGCTTSVMNDITAAFNTQGYWLLDYVAAQFQGGGFYGWGALIYVCAVFAGIIMMALGQPPRLYLWYIVGPCIYYWIINTKVGESDSKSDITVTYNENQQRGVKGVCWYVGDLKLPQKRVWELAEAGMVNMPKTGKTTVTYHWDNATTTGTEDFNYNLQRGPNGSASNIPAVFLFLDEVISEAVVSIVNITGIKSLEKNSSGNLTLDTPADYNTLRLQGSRFVNKVEKSPSWYVLSNTRWEELIDITNASLEGQDDLREAFIRFMASECGDKIKEHINDVNYITAGARRAGGMLPESVIDGGNYDSLIKSFRQTLVPVPPEIREIMSKHRREGTLGNFISKYASSLDEDWKPKGDADSPLEKRITIDCNEYIYFLIQGFRWASAIQYNLLVKRGTDLGIPATWVTYNFLYGWKFKNNRDEELVGENIRLNLLQQFQFIDTLIFAYMFRNELSTASRPIDQTFSQSTILKNVLDSNVRSVGGMNKGMEFYQWAKLIPYVQGVCLMFLSAAFPIACLLMLIPGWHKAIITWLGFYAWAKSWDAGFAIIGSLDKNIWGMLGNSEDASIINSRIYSMINANGFNQMLIENGQPQNKCNATDTYALIDCQVPHPSSVRHGLMDAVTLFDQGLILANNLQHDIANSYYIYLMSALYFAVPAITGQLLLGAKAGFASLMTQPVSAVAGDAARGVSSAYASEIQNRGAHAMSVTGQEAFAKEMRKDGSFAQSAMDIGNIGLKANMASAEHGLIAQMINASASQHGHQRAAEKAAWGFWNDAANKFPALSSGNSKSSLNEVDGDNNGDKSETSSGSTKSSAIASIIASAGIAGIGIRDANEQGHFSSEAAKENDKAQKLAAIGQYQRSLEGRLGETAHQQAAEAQWRAQRKLGNQMARSSAAVGVMAGAFTAGPKPTNMNGMIGMGYMNNHQKNGTLLGSDRSGSFFTFGGAQSTIDSGKWGEHAMNNKSIYDDSPLNNYGLIQNTVWGGESTFNTIGHDLTSLPTAVQEGIRQGASTIDTLIGTNISSKIQTPEAHNSTSQTAANFGGYGAIHNLEERSKTNKQNGEDARPKHRSGG